MLKAGLESRSGPIDPQQQATSSSPRAARAGAFVPPTPEELADSFPQLEILELLGQGGMGAVYKARQPGLDRLVALKILPPEIGRDPAFAERFTREARALARLNHPQHRHRPRLRPSAGGSYYFVMEFVDGVNLRQAIQARRADAGRGARRSCRRSATRCNSPTTKASSIATSSRRTSCSTRRAA